MGPFGEIKSLGLDPKGIFFIAYYAGSRYSVLVTELVRGEIQSQAWGLDSVLAYLLLFDRGCYLTFKPISSLAILCPAHEISVKFKQG